MSISELLAGADLAAPKAEAVRADVVNVGGPIIHAGHATILEVLALLENALVDYHGWSGSLAGASASVVDVGLHDVAD